MKKLLYISFLALIAVFFIQCDSEDDLMTENALEGGLVDLSTTSINYVIGSGASYTFDLFVHQEGAVKVNSINLYKSCFYAAAIPWSDPAAHDFDVEPADSVPAKYTDEILEHTITITETSVSHSVATLDWAWADLREGLTTEEGGELPADEGSMEIGNYFQIRVEAVLSDGRVVQMATPVRMTVSTRFAGTYVSLGGAYYHPDYNPAPYLSPLWLGEEVSISSIDAITYRVEEWGIQSSWTGNVLYFQIDPSTGAITYPEEWAGVAQTLNGLPLIVPERNAGDLTFAIPAAGPNMNTAIKDDVEGKDRLNMCYGYMGTSGSREFYILLEKVLN
ncbi:MAG TPA: hypothetical protein DCG75_13175 [Bacteroidales bacterium]|jgi:hypothetical protein|nr:hypothetical protein [Bacteroidales bacterium]